MDDVSLKELKFESQTSYTILEEIGRGGLGVIYLAARNSGGVKDYVVLKALKRLNSEDEELLRVETNSAATLHHENIVKTYGLESIPLSELPPSFCETIQTLSYKKIEKKQRYEFRRLNFRDQKHDVDRHIPSGLQENRILLIAMDFVDGLNLHELHQEHLNMSILIPEKFGAFIVSRIARALGYAHNYMVHKDVSPQNILINTHGICKLGDFGVEGVASKRPDYLSGKLPYIPPEKYLKTLVDERTDLFALGLIAYEILTGISLFHTSINLPIEQRIGEIKKRIASGILPPSKVRKDIPEELSQIIVKMLNPSSVLRYQRAITVANHLEKKYMYSKGYGPTNNSLANYLHIFETGFSHYTEDQLQNLSFLKNTHGEIQLRRRFDFESYTELGIDLMKQTNYALFDKIRGEQRVEAKSEDLHCIKLKHLDNVIESFPVEVKDILIGSSEEATIVLPEAGIQPQHCKIAISAEAIFIKPLGDLEKPILINEKVMEEQRELREGDKIEICSRQLFFIKQSNVDVQQPEKVLNVTPDMDISFIEKISNFALKIPMNNQNFATCARILQNLLEKTNLSDMKKGVIPTAFMETLAFLKSSQENLSLNVQIIKSAVRILIRCSGFDDKGYQRLLSTFNKHREELAKELTEEEEPVGSTSIDGIPDDLFKSQDEIATSDDSLTDNLSDDDDSDDFDSDLDIDLDALESGEAFDADILGAVMMVHSFDRIEFKKMMKEIELVVNYS